MELKTSELFPASFNPDFQHVINHNYTEFVEHGGRGSCKSSFISICIVLLVLMFPFVNVLILRKTARTLRRSVFEQILWAINKLKVADRFNIPRSSTAALPITYKKTGQMILFAGVDDPSKIKSIKTSTGYIAVTWFEEASEFTESDMHTVKLSTLRGGSMFWVFESFNPPASIRNWKNRDVQTKKANRLVHLSDYRTVPAEWLGEAFLFEAEQMKKQNKRAYDNIFLGKATGTGRNIFENVTLKTITDTQIAAFDWHYYGIDWGYYPDPFMWGAMSYDAKKHTLYIYDELKLLKHGNWEASEALKNHHENMSDRITADSAEPKSIADFYRWGWNIAGAKKGKGSLEAGFKWLQGLKQIIIDPKRCPNAADEFSLYEYEIDKTTGEVLSGYPQGQPDHYMALTRYALESVYKRSGA
ncbi:PBSX family phage terminase large subunit [Treponema lecithinolyticum]